VAGSARRRRWRHVCSNERKTRHAVIEGRGIPAFRCVTVRAVGCCKRGTGGRVHGIIRLLPSGQMTLRISAARRRNLQVVIVVDVARGTRNICMAVGQQKAGNRVVESGQIPSRGGVAVRAIRSSK